MRLSLSLLFCLLLASFTSSQLEDLRGTLDQLCNQKCMPRFKDEGICSSFCRFVPHIVEQHGELLLELYGIFKRQEPLEWAMDDVVRYRAENHIEDDHKIGIMYFQSYAKWNDYLKRHSEL